MIFEACSFVELVFAYSKPFDRQYAPQSIPFLANALHKCYQDTRVSGGRPPQCWPAKASLKGVELYNSGVVCYSGFN